MLASTFFKYILESLNFAYVCKFGEIIHVPIYKIINYNIKMLHFVWFRNVTSYTDSMVSRNHVNTTKLGNITCTLVATCVILQSLKYVL
jgi:hypothetical protein